LEYSAMVSKPALTPRFMAINTSSMPGGIGTTMRATTDTNAMASAVSPPREEERMPGLLLTEVRGVGGMF